MRGEISSKGNWTYDIHGQYSRSIGRYRSQQILQDVYDTGYKHDEAYMVAEAMVEYDELFQLFRAHHIQLIHRSIGMGSKSLKGRPVELLNAGMRHRFFPELWDVRCEMTDRWGAEYGVKRDSISGASAAGHGSGL